MKNKIIAGLVFIVSIFLVIVCGYAFFLDRKTSEIFSKKTAKERFTKIYELDYWVQDATGSFTWKAFFNKKTGPSGVGGLKENSLPYLEFLQNFIDTHQVRSIIDLGCGDFLLMKHLKIPSNMRYRGIDLVDALIADNEKKYSKENIKFESIDSLEDFEKQSEKYAADLLIIKDTMQLWALPQIQNFIKNTLPKYKYVIIVNNFFPLIGQQPQNADSTVAESRPINLETAPFFMKINVALDYVGGCRHKRVYLYKSPLFQDEKIEDKKNTM